MNIRFLYDTAPQHPLQNILLQNVRNNDSFIITVHLLPERVKKNISAKRVSQTAKPNRRYALRQANRIITVISYSYEKGTHKPPTYMELRSSPLQELH